MGLRVAKKLRLQGTLLHAVAGRGKAVRVRAFVCGAAPLIGTGSGLGDRRDRVARPGQSRHFELNGIKLCE